MAEAAIRVLLVEDDEDDYVLTRDLLAEIGPGRFVLDWVRDCATATRALARRDHDVCLIDYRIGECTGLDVLSKAVELEHEAPVILLTGQGGREVDEQALRAGAADFLLKARLDAPSLDRAIRYAVGRKRAESALRRLQAELEDRVRDRTAALEAEIAARTRLEEELRRRVAQLADEDRRKNEFLAALGHELRNPLGPILNAVEVLRRGPAGPDAEAARELIARQAGHLARLVDDLLDVARITHGKIELRRQPVDLAAVAGRAAEAVGPLMVERGHEFRVELPGCPLPLEADPTRLEQVLSNLLTNAAKYTPPGGRVALAVGRDGGEAVVRVRDTGVGIAPDVLPRVFEMFVQASDSSSHSPGGLGLGLAVVRRLAELHGGTAAAHSAGPGAGSEFVVRLPIANSEPGARSAERSESSALRAPSSALRILVVDDNADGANSLAALLRLDRHEVWTAHDGPAGLAAVRERRPDVVFLDIGLPGLDGYEVARRIRCEPGLGGVALVALTGYGREDDQRRSREAGFDRHLVKPIDPAELPGLLAGLRGGD
jgi:signal transduction histidine kinase